MRTTFEIVLMLIISVIYNNDARDIVRMRASMHGIFVCIVSMASGTFVSDRQRRTH